MRNLIFIATGAALVMLGTPGVVVGEAVPPAPDANVARYCTSCATVQSVRMVGQRFELVLRFANGSMRTLRYDNDPGFRAGDKVRFNAGVLTRDE